MLAVTTVIIVITIILIISITITTWLQAQLIGPEMNT